MKFIGTHAEYDRIDPKDRVMAKKMIRPVRTETECDEALEEIETERFPPGASPT